MGRIKIDYGIDLGTTNSALAVINKGEIEIKNIDRANIVPSCVAYNRKGNVRAGITALSEKGNHTDHSYHECITSMGAWLTLKAIEDKSYFKL